MGALSLGAAGGDGPTGGGLPRVAPLAAGVDEQPVAAPTRAPAGEGLPVTPRAETAAPASTARGDTPVEDAVTAAPRRERTDARTPSRRVEPVKKPTPAFPSIRWRRSHALGSHTSGRLVRGVLLPAAGEGFVTWDPIRRRSPNRAWRRWGSDQLVRALVGVLRTYRTAHPDAPPVVIGDLSRPDGGEFGSRFGGLGHVSHQNGLDVDIYYPRRDGALRPPARPAQIDRVLARHLVRLWLDAGARFVFVGPRTGLTAAGPRARVQAIRYHDDHMHVRLVRRGG